MKKRKKFHDKCVQMGIMVYNKDKKGGNTPVLPNEEKAVELMEEIEVLMAQHKIQRYKIAEKLDYNRRSLYVWFNNPERHYGKLLMVRNTIKKMAEESNNG